MANLFFIVIIYNRKSALLKTLFIIKIYRCFLIKILKAVLKRSDLFQHFLILKAAVANHSK